MLINRIVAVLLLSCCATAPVAAQEETAQEDEGRPDITGLGVPEGLEIEWRGKLIQDADGTTRFTGPVTIQWQDSRIQADRMSIRKERYLEAEGNVLVVWGQSRIFGSRMSYDLKTERGIIEDAMGQTLDEYVFWAKTAEKIGADKVHLKSATVTTCTQPVPYWSFSVSSATIRVDNYARMWNVRFKAGKAPLIYLPYLIWPIKQDRAPGLLMPTISSTLERGFSYQQQLFLPFNRSTDLTLDARWFSKAGLGLGADLRAIPNANGSLEVEGFFIDDRVYASTNDGKGQRGQAFMRQEQRFQNGFRLTTDIDWVSDPEFLSDYVRDINIASTPQTLFRVQMSRNGSWISTNVRELRREQLASGLIQQTLPEIEFRGRNRQVGRTPLYVEFEASGASIQQRTQTLSGAPPFDPDYIRGDLQANVSLPFSKIPWLDVTPEVSHRTTYYTQRQGIVDEGRVVVDEALTRGLSTAGLEIIGPKIMRIYRPNRPASSHYKHSIEPRIRYGYAERFEDPEQILIYDEIDRINGNGQQVNYALAQRLFAKRPRAPEELLGFTETVFLPDGTKLETSTDDTTAAEDQKKEETHTEPVEIASLQISQTRSFTDDISRADVDGDGELETSPYSPVVFTGRYQPDSGVNIDLQGSWDILFHAMRTASVSGTIQKELARLRFSVVHNNGLGLDSFGEEIADSTQARLTAGLSFMGGKLLFNLDGSYTSNPAEGVSHFPDQRYQFTYATQCCTIFIERLTRDFATTDARREVSFRLDLRGIGKILSSTF